MATQESERDALRQIQNQAIENGIMGEDSLSLVDQKTLHEWEPEVRGVEALFSPSTGIINSHALMESFSSGSKRKGSNTCFFLMRL